MRRTGMHWRDIKNGEFRNLAMWSAYADDPSMTDAETEHDGTITVVFGSQPANLTLRSVDSEAVHIFKHGHCAALAYAIHQKTELPFIVFTSDTAQAGRWSGHAGLLVDGKVLDVEGFHTVEQVMKDYRITTEPVVTGEREFVSMVVDADYQADVLYYLGELERFVLDDFADFIIETHVK